MENWRRGTLLHPFCRLVLRAVRGVPPPWVIDPASRSETLRNYRLQANLSQTALAAKLGVTLSAVARWEQGKATPSRESWRALSALLPCL
jgi:DNA-binding XRE family transcriptional regulator